MADNDTTPANLLFLAAAQPCLSASGDPEWDRRFAEWLRRDALARSDASFGRYAEACEAYDLAKANVQTGRGEQHLRTEAAKRELEPTSAAVDEAERRSSEDYLAPLWEAAAALALTPAPNLAAALFKVELVRTAELGNCAIFDDRANGRTAMDVVTADFDRLGGGAARDPIDHYHVALREFGAGKMGEDAYSAAYDAMRDFEPLSLRDFARQFIALYDDGSPVDYTRDMLIERARRLAA